MVLDSALTGVSVKTQDFFFSSFTAASGRKSSPVLVLVPGMILKVLYVVHRLLSPSVVVDGSSLFIVMTYNCCSSLIYYPHSCSFSSNRSWKAVRVFESF